MHTVHGLIEEHLKRIADDFVAKCDINQMCKNKT